MPESAALPAVLRQNLSSTEQAVLTLGARGGARQVYLHVDAVRSEKQAGEMIERVREKAGRLLNTTRANGNGAGPKMCAQHGEFVDRGRGCPACNPEQGGGSRPKPAPAKPRSAADAPPLPPSAPRRPKRRAREGQRERSAEAQRRAELRRKALEVAGVEDDLPPVPSEQDDTLQQLAGEEHHRRSDPPGAPPPAADDFASNGGPPANATDGAPLRLRRPTGEERAARAAQIGPIVERGERQAVADEQGPWPREDRRHAAKGASVEEQLGGRVPAPQGREAAMQRRRTRILCVLREGPKSIKALGVMFGLTAHQVRNDLKWLRAEGSAEPTGRNVYDWPDANANGGRSSAQWRITPDGQVEFEKSLRAGEETTPGEGAADVADETPAAREEGEESPAVNPETPQAEEEPAPLPPPTVPPVPSESGDPVSVPAPRRSVREEERVLRDVRRRIEESHREHVRVAHELAVIVEEMDAELPESILRARYLAALLRRIEQGDTSPDLLDRFERLAGLRE